MDAAAVTRQIQGMFADVDVVASDGNSFLFVVPRTGGRPTTGSRS